jgi:hypothetical protein
MVRDVFRVWYDLARAKSHVTTFEISDSMECVSVCAREN